MEQALRHPSGKNTACTAGAITRKRLALLVRSSTAVVKVAMPPMAVPMSTPQRVVSSSDLASPSQAMPACWSACQLTTQVWCSHSAGPLSWRLHAVHGWVQSMGAWCGWDSMGLGTSM